MKTFIATIATLAVFGACIYAAAMAAKHEREACEALGGRIISKPTTGVGVSGSGDVVATFGSIDFCISPDGRILR